MFQGLDNCNNRTCGIPFLATFYSQHFDSPISYTIKGESTKLLTGKTSLTSPLYFQSEKINRQIKTGEKNLTEQKSWSRGVPILPFIYYQSNDCFEKRKRLWMLPLLYLENQKYDKFISMQLPLWYYTCNKSNKDSFLWSLLWISDTSNNGENKIKSLIPLFYSNENEKYSSLLTAPGIYRRHWKDDSEDMLWALLWYSRNTVKPVCMTDKKYDDKTQSLFPLFWFRQDMYSKRYLSMPGFYLRKTLNSKEMYSSFLWPLVKYEEDPGGNSYWRFWPVISSERKFGFPALFDFAGNRGQSSWRFLWFFLNCEKDASGKVKHFSILNRLYRYNRSRDVVNIDIFPAISWDTASNKSKFSILGGLYSCQDINGKRSGKIFYIPWGN